MAKGCLRFSCFRPPAMVVVFLLVSVLLNHARRTRAQEHPPHIVIMLADDLGWEDVSYNGSVINTPNIDSLAERGTRLNQFYVQPVCSPTRGALLTGRYPMRLGLQCGVVRPWAQHGLPVDEQTLPESLKAAGYQTAIVGKWHLGHNRREYLPLSRGFDQQYGHYNGALDYFTHIRDGGFDWHQNDQRNDDVGYATDLIGQEAVRIIREYDKSHPLFLYVPFNAPHTPLQAPEEYVEEFSDWQDQRRATYAAMVRCLDDAVGDIVTALNDNQFSPSNTLIFFCSDNGGIPSLGSNGELRSGKGTLYEGGVRVPAIMVLEERLGANEVVNEPMHIVDLYPTLLNLAMIDVDQAKPVDGKDIWPTLTEGHPSPHDVIVHNLNPFCGAIRMGDWKLIRNGRARANDTQAPRVETWELFNIAEDPFEKNDLSAERPAILEQLKSRFAELASEAVEPNIPPNRSPVGFQTPEVWGESND